MKKIPFPQFGNGKGMRKKTFPNFGHGKGIKKRISEDREREGNEKSNTIIRDRESEAFIPRNATSLVHNHFEDYLVSILTQLCDRMTCQRIVDRIIECIFGK